MINVEEVNEMKLVDESALSEAKELIRSMICSNTQSGRLMAYGANAVLEVLGLQEEVR